MLNKQPDNRICDELKGEIPRNSVDQTKQEQPSPFNSDSRERFQIEIKTGRSSLIILIRFLMDQFQVIRDSWV